MKFMKAVFLLIACFFIACSYAPISKISQNLFSDKIYVNVAISQSDPRASVFVIDTLREVVINRLGKLPSLKEEAQDFIFVTMENLNYEPIAYDENGYVVAYRVELMLNFNVCFANSKTQNIKARGSYDFAISANSIISDSARLEAVRSASSEAFDEFISILAIKGYQNGKYQ